MQKLDLLTKKNMYCKLQNNDAKVVGDYNKESNKNSIKKTWILKTPRKIGEQYQFIWRHQCFRLEIFRR